MLQNYEDYLVTRGLLRECTKSRLHLQHFPSAEDTWGGGGRDFNYSVLHLFLLPMCTHTSLCMRAGGKSAMVGMRMTENTGESVLCLSFCPRWGLNRSSGCTASTLTSWAFLLSSPLALVPKQECIFFSITLVVILALNNGIIFPDPFFFPKGAKSEGSLFKVYIYMYLIHGFKVSSLIFFLTWPGTLSKLTF